MEKLGVMFPDQNSWARTSISPAAPLPSTPRNVAAAQMFLEYFARARRASLFRQWATTAAGGHRAGSLLDRTGYR
jgi:hypothetical protein